MTLEFREEDRGAYDKVWVGKVWVSTPYYGDKWMSRVPAN